MAVISPYEDQRGTRNAAALRSRSFLLEARQDRLCLAQSRNSTMYDGSEMVRTKDRIALSGSRSPRDRWCGSCHPLIRPAVTLKPCGPSDAEMRATFLQRQ